MRPPFFMSAGVLKRCHIVNAVLKHGHASLVRLVLMTDSCVI